MIFLTDGKRHLICQPYSIENLHSAGEKIGENTDKFHQLYGAILNAHKKLNE